MENQVIYKGTITRGELTTQLPSGRWLSVEIHKSFLPIDGGLEVIGCEFYLDPSDWLGRILIKFKRIR